MIIFEIDGVLADIEHRRHFVDPKKRHPNGLFMNESCVDEMGEPTGVYFKRDQVTLERTKDLFNPERKAFYEACEKDEVIQPVLDTFIHLTQGEPFNHDVRIWCGRCESVRHKTLNWLVNMTGYCEDLGYWDRRLKMRPIGDDRPAHELKNLWYHDLYILEGEKIQMVFESDHESIAMYRRRGIFVFDCRQN